MQFPVRGRGALWSAAAAAGALFLVSCGGEGYDSAPTPRTYATTVVVGASLSDTGNTCNLIPVGGCPPAPPYAAGRNSNGPLFVEVLAAGYGASVSPSRTGGNNFSFAGARTGSVQAAILAAPAANGIATVTVSAATGTAPSVPGMNSATGANPSQIDALLTRFNFQIAPQTLVIVDATTAGNNIADALALTQAFAALPNGAANNIGPAVVTGAVTDVVTVINRLYAAGARNILVINAPNIGQTPRVVTIGGAAPAGATALAAGFNAGLAGQINILRSTLSGASITLFDLFALEALIKAGTAPGQPTFSNVTAACFTPTPTPVVCATPATYFYWDSFHPTAALGAYVASRLAAAIPAP